MASGIIYPKNPLLKEYIQYYWYLSTDNNGKSGDTILPPEPYSDIILSFEGPTSFETVEKKEIVLNGSFIFSMRKERFLVTSRKGIHYLAIRFYPHTLYNFIRFPLSELRDSKAIEMELINKAFWNSLTDRLYGISDLNDKIVSLESELVKLLSKGNIIPGDSRLSPIISQMIGSAGQINIDSLLEKYELNSKKLERLFLKYIGLSPKSYCRVLRFTNVFDFLNSNTVIPDWADVVSDYGYYDQSHLIREFSDYVGYSPEKYLKIKDSLCC